MSLFYWSERGESYGNKEKEKNKNKNEADSESNKIEEIGIRELTSTYYMKEVQG
ncbi:MAG: hypothetical protein V1244_00205 [Nitrospinaceae bacterium]|nr:hypothetical protein [Nitrospinaceae bacterium]